MLRTLVLLLLLANALLLAAQLGVLEPLTSAAAGQREPERLQRQLNPERVSILTAEAASAALRAAAASAAASKAPVGVCLQAGPFGSTDADAALRTLRDAGIATALWQSIRSEDPGVFIIYMGRYPDRETLQRKLAEVKRLHLETEDLRGSPELQPGFSLGRFDGKAAADAALARMTQRGLRTARVITLRAPSSQTLLRVPSADATLRARLAGLQLPDGPGFVDCPTPAAAPAAASAPASSAASVAAAAPAPAAASTAASVAARPASTPPRTASR